MQARHQRAPQRRPLRWLVGAGLAAVVGAATVIGFSLGSSASAAPPPPVSATFGVTGVATSGCPVSAGGTDVYVKPGQALKVRSSLVGLYVLEPTLLGGSTVVDLNDVVSSVGSFDGALTIDAGTRHAIKLKVSNKNQTVSGLSSGNHSWTWTVDTVKLLGLVPLPLHIDTKAVGAGTKLSWTGTIHVTAARNKCGIALQLPSAHVSAHVKGAPPIDIGIPGVTASVPVPGNHGGQQTHSSAPAAGGGSTTRSTTAVAPQGPPVPAGVVPEGDNAAVYPGGGGNGGFGSLPLPNLLNPASGSVSSGSHHGKNGSAEATQKSTGKNKTIDLAASKASTGQLSVVLAIIAVIALTLVAATYARLYLLRKD